MNDLIDILCILSGAYLVYAAIVMKKQGRIIGNVMLKKGTDESNIKDKEGFIQFLFGKILFFGIVIMLGGIANFLNSYLAGPDMVTTIVCCVFAAALVGYGVVTNKAMRKFME